jgi:ParB-like chromosome segregation protein Spo0J
MYDMNYLVDLKKEYNEKDDKIEFLNTIRDWIHKELSELKSQPIDRVLWVPVDKIQANDYNPNSVAKIEMKLLYVSILNDGYTQPIVTIYDKEIDKYIIVDGFHRYFVCKNNKDIYDRNKGMLPIVIIDKDINDRMASTIRHNRARGKHSVKGMANIVFEMLDGGWDDKEICNQLGMEPEELLRLKHITGFSKLFENTEYSKSWESRNQILLRKKYGRKA